MNGGPSKGSLGDFKYSNCEYLVKMDLDGINEDLLKKVYDVIMTAHFPMSLNPKNRNANSQVSIDFFPNCQLIPIPKSLYQLFYMEYHLNEIQSLSPDTLSLEYFEKKGKLSFNWTPAEDLDYNSYCAEYLNRQAVFDEWRTLNAFILSIINEGTSLELDVHLNKIVNQLVDEIVEIVNKNLNKHKTFSFFVNTSRFLMSMNNAGIKELINDIIKFEWSCRDNPQHIIYRGTPDFNTRDRGTYQNEPLTLSYSDGLFSGFCNDASTGMCFSYLLNSDAMCTAALVSHHELYENTVKPQFFHIPPLPAIAGMNGDLEYHHPRSKIANVKNSFVGNVPYGLRSGIHKISDAESESKARALLAMPEFDDVTIHNEKLRDKLKEKIIIVKERDSIKNHNIAILQRNYTNSFTPGYQITHNVKEARIQLNHEIQSFDKNTLKGP